MTWSENSVLTNMVTRAAGEINAPTGVTYKIKDTKLYVPVVTLSTQGDNKLLEQLKTEFKKTIKWNKSKSGMTNQAKTKNSNYLIDPTFNKINRLFALSFENDDARFFFLEYYTPKIDIKDFNNIN